jgi:hypothetical protein
VDKACLFSFCSDRGNLSRCARTPKIHTSKSEYIHVYMKNENLAFSGVRAVSPGAGSVPAECPR